MKASSPTVKRARARKKKKGHFHHGDLREAAIEEAVRVIERDGAPALSLRKIAKSLGVTDPALYRHFGSRDELLAEVGLRGYLAVVKRQAAAVERADTPRNALLNATKAYLLHCVENLGWFRLTHSRDFQDQYGQLDGASELGEVAAQTEQAIKRHLATVVPAAQVDDHYRAYWALAIGLTTLVAERAFRRVDSDAERLAVAERVLELQVDTLLSKSH